MSRTLLLLPVLALAAGMSTVPLFPASAQCRLCDSPTTSREEGSASGPISLEIETSLDFDRLILLGAGSGTATLLPDGSRSVSGVISDISGRAMAGSAVVRGEAGRTVRVELPRRIELYSLSGGRITIEDIVSDLPPVARLDSAGSLSFRFGGRLRIMGDAEGDYRGDVPITVEYL
ncbi:DUF4402 domain-containing protein [Sphingomonas sp.]|uniref:DUF4402 domain-containing protein n=1 Tax=Sphingomonas sp. TaxID=28214 RepID=UPI0017F6B240|nr:DUF4402 domain-containing protein [Sphingomonas sp.]MBA3511240.1 DUF4402 domain-containing protein [Sphingomonas sp.]